MLVITDERQTTEAIRGLSFRRLVCLFGSRTREEAYSARTRAVVLALLAAKCSGFVCFGPQSEVLHDVVDEIIVEQQLIQGGAVDSEVTTTWHDDEAVEDVVHFFISVIGADDDSLLVAVLSPTDDELRRVLLADAVQ